MSFRITPSRAGLLGLFLLTLVAAWFHLSRASADYPVWDGDAVGYWPHVVSYAREHRLSNPLYEGYLKSMIGIQTDGNTYAHGFLTPLLLARLSGGDYHSLRMVMTVAHLISLGLLLAAARRIIPAGTVWTHGVVAGILVTAIFTWSCSDLSRPEPFTCLPVCLGLYLTLGRSWSRMLSVAFGVGAGIVFWFNPAPGILLIALIGTFLLTARASIREKLELAFLFSISAGISIAGIFLMFYPGNREEFFRVFFAIGHQNIARLEMRELSGNFLMNPGRPLLLCTLLGGFVALVRQVRVNSQTSPDRWLSAVVVGCLLLSGWVLGCRAPGRNYVFLPLFPVILILCVPLVCQWLGTRRQAGPVAHLVVGLLALAALANLAAMAGDLVRFQAYLRYGVPLHVTTAVIHDLRAAHPHARLAVSSALFPCVVGDQVTELDDPILPRTADFLIIQQVNRSKPAPGQIPGYLLVSHSFVTHVPRLIVPVGRLTPSYGAALYEKIKGAP